MKKENKIGFAAAAPLGFGSGSSFCAFGTFPSDERTGAADRKLVNRASLDTKITEVSIISLGGREFHEKKGLKLIYNIRRF